MIKTAQKIADLSSNKKVVLDSKETYAAFAKFIDAQIVEVRKDRRKANSALQSTGMYDANGRLKPEFR